MKPKTYTIQLWQQADGTHRLTRVNNGFGPIELRGILEVIREDLVFQRAGQMPAVTYHGHTQATGKVAMVVDP